MRSFSLRCGTGTSAILCGETLPLLPEYAPASSTLAVTDARVRRALGPAFPDLPFVELGEGEASKSLASLEAVYRALLERGADRGWTVLGVGGGLVCDVAGFAAATFMRGIRCGFVPTTLLAQVDASVGGKNGINVSGYKNIAGVFRQPDFVLCDPAVLRSLREEDFRAGFGEAVKHAVLASEDYFAYLEENAGAALARDPAALREIVAGSVAIKADVVARDEKEAGPRATLNLGHTIGHGVEAVLGVRHGEAVSIGMAAAFALAVELGACAAGDRDRALALLARYGLPTRLRGAVPADTADRVVEAVLMDKKRDGDRVKFVLPERIGSARLEPIGFAALEAAVRKALS